MSNYKKMKEAFQKEKRSLYDKLREHEKNIAKLKKIKIIVNNILEQDADNIDKDELLRLRKYFPNLDEIYEMYIRINDYHNLIRDNRLDEIDIDLFVKDIERCHKLYGIPPYYAVIDIKKTASIIKKIKQGNFQNISNEDMEIFLGRDDDNSSHVLYSSSGALRDMLLLECLRSILRELEKDKEEDLSKNVDDIKERISIVDKYNKMFSDDELLIKFESVDELNTFSELIESLLSDDECIEILYDVQIDQKKEEKEIIKVTFDNLDLTKFTIEEKDTIKELQDILSEEDINDNSGEFKNVDISYIEREEVYKNTSMENILSDVNILLNNIYDKKDEVIKIFKLIIDLYRKHTIRKIREDRELSLLKIRDDFVNILTFINRTYVDRDSAYNDEKKIISYIESINTEYLPLIKELMQTNENDEYYDDEIDRRITSFKNIIKNFKKQMTAYYEQDDEIVDVKENTDNLVFCLNNDIDLSQEGFRKEFAGTVSELESKSSRELLIRPGRKGMTRLRKNTESNGEKDFVKYLENRYRTHLHFVPYRYSGSSFYRTGLIKFEPSAKVKSFLEERYGLSKQSAYYGIFMIITTIAADHSEYSRLHEYVFNNYEDIEKIALLFASENPDYDKLIDLIDSLLTIKKDNLEIANTDIKKSR